MGDLQYAILVGLLVGTLVGLTGLGGAVLTLPLLILGLGVPPLIAVGTGAMFSFFTKIAGACVHGRRRNVDWDLALMMALGSFPGGLAGVALLAWLRAWLGDGVNDFLHIVIGVLLIAIPLATLVQTRAVESGEKPLRDRLPPWVKRRHGAIFTGLVGGVLVGMTSVGSGSVIMLLLLLFFRRPANLLVGTDIVHAVILTGVAGLGHLGLGTVDLSLTAWLLVGSIPGVLLGSSLTAAVSPAWLRRGLLLLLILVGMRMTSGGVLAFD